MNKKPLYLIGGPTASGKTARALELAARENGAIINTDAMQIYAGLPLLTAQPLPAEKAQAPHALFEALDPAERSSAGRWLSLAKEALERFEEQGHTPIFVGGTGLYFSALLGGLAVIPEIPETVRADITARYEALGHDAFRAELAKHDPESATRLMPNDRQRLIRAMEVAVHTGHPLAYWQQTAKAENDLAERFDIRRVVILPERDKLYAACDARFLKMMEQGALEEVRALAERKLDPDLPAMKILGVPELAAHLRGEIGLSEAVAKAQQATRNYAKRQVTWFKNQWNEAG